jgi:hypothetical protein
MFKRAVVLETLAFNKSWLCLLSKIFYKPSNSNALFKKKKLSFILLSASCCDLGGDEDVLRTKMPCQGDRSGRMGPYAESQHQNSISTHSMLAATCMEEEEQPDSESEEADAGVSNAGRVPVVQQLTLSH